MSNPPWFYYPFQTLSSDSLEITGPEVKHITGAKRLRVGDEIVLMNGRGGLAHCVLESADPRGRRLNLQIGAVESIAPASTDIVIASALPKGDRLSTMLDMLTQLGMSHFQPVQFERSVSKWSSNLKARCERIVIEASKQSKCAWVPVIEQEIVYKSLLNERIDARHIVILADQSGRQLNCFSQTLKTAKQIRLLIGPEGGLSQRENVLSQGKNINIVKLAVPILRIETAAVAAISALNQIGIK